MAFAESLHSLLAAVNESPRLRVGLWLILGVGWLYGLLLMRDEFRAANTEYQTVAKNVSRTRAQSSQTEWTARVELTQSLQLEQESRMWREGTIGLAQATFQDWLNQATQQSNLPRILVTVAAQEDNAQEKGTSVRAESNLNRDIWKVSAKVGFDFTPKGLYAFLGRLDGHDRQIVVESLNVRGAPVSRAEMVLVAYFQKPAAAEGVAGLSDAKADQVRR